MEPVMYCCGTDIIGMQIYIIHYIPVKNHKNGKPVRT